MSEDVVVSIARIGGSFGVSGEVKVKSLTDFPDRFQTLSDVILSRSGKTRDLFARVTGVKYHKNSLIIKLDISNTVEDARSFSGFFICIEKKDLYPLPKGSFYLFQLIGMDVYSREGEFIGKLTDIYKLPANDVFIVTSGEQEILIPAIKEFVDEIKPESGRIVVHLREGLI